MDVESNEWMAGWTMVRAVHRLEKSLAEVFQGRKVWVDEDGEAVRLIVPASGGDDYQFAVSIHSGLSELEITAVPLEALSSSSYFWYRPYERPDFDSFERMLSRLEQDLMTCITHDTQIRQHKGLFFWWLNLEYFDQSWVPLYRHSALRWGANVPPISGRERTYRRRSSGSRAN